MRKFNFIAVLLVISVMLTGIGYAAWSQNIQINSTITTGNFDVVWEKPDKASCPADPFVKASIEQDPSDLHTLILTVNNIYPGGEFHFDPKALNVGTIPAKISNVTMVTTNDPDNILPYMEYHGYYAWSQDGSPNSNVKDISGCDWKPLSGIANDLKANKDFMSIKLDPKGWLQFDHGKCIHIRMSDKAPNTTTEGKTLKFKLTFDWVQAVP
ncbi:hypothetical protein [Pseudobacteroides cellulosolvens]|uniref:SipW-cognate class signal peptide n=1 Tax=Pseudobacteroides cellulosolvens ATCC 35603 = DSM 2933 TaxID=398512 RepID=A0A0L6JJF1_9FIRM|nr:hypothetical protein [Pseudobacteroides cellulosolvens]KNY25547.1 hypothetical protein Bccel_0807 [Pseudobacteroides cellulosolvens ATCC 35603 = DSM 2933]